MNEDKLLEAALSAFKHGTGHDEKEHGNWARNMGGLAAAEFKDQPRHWATSVVTDAKDEWQGNARRKSSVAQAVINVRPTAGERSFQFQHEVSDVGGRKVANLKLSAKKGRRLAEAHREGMIKNLSQQLNSHLQKKFVIMNRSSDYSRGDVRNNRDQFSENRVFELRDRFDRGDRWDSGLLGHLEIGADARGAWVRFREYTGDE